MKKLMWFAVGCTALLWSSVGFAQDCAGDCDGDNTVAINELITCVNIALGSSPVSACPSCDTNDDGEVAINELIGAVNNALLPMCPSDGPVCGDGTRDEGEECDDGNNFGGDDCAVNCTTEDARVGIFDPTKTLATVQTEALPIGLPLTGRQTFRTGHMRSTATALANGQTFPAGEIPVAIRANELLFDPVKVTGLVCACVRGVAQDSFGPGISGSGSIGCGSQGLSDINFRNIQDHNTTPGAAGNVNQGSPDDAECDDTTTLPGGFMSAACLEGTGALCNDENSQHIGACNGPRVLTRSGGPTAMGTALILNSTAIGLLQDAGTCRTDKPMRNGKCLYDDYGPDCLPCTDDDADKGNTEVNPTTSGTTEAAVFDANNASAVIDEGLDCFGAPCITKVEGSVFNCAELTPGTSGGLSGGSIAVAFPSVDAATIGDNVTSTVFFNQ